MKRFMVTMLVLVAMAAGVSAQTPDEVLDGIWAGRPVVTNDLHPAGSYPQTWESKNLTYIADHVPEILASVDNADAKDLAERDHPAIACCAVYLLFQVGPDGRDVSNADAIKFIRKIGFSGWSGYYVSYRMTDAEWATYKAGGAWPVTDEETLTYTACWRFGDTAWFMSNIYAPGTSTHNNALAQNLFLRAVVNKTPMPALKAISKEQKALALINNPDDAEWDARLDALFATIYRDYQAITE